VPGYDFLNFASEDTRIAAPPLKSMKRFFEPEDLWPDGYTQSVTHGVQLPWPETWEKYAFTYSRDPSERKIGPVELFHDATNAGELVYRLGAAEGLYYTDTIERQRRGRPADDDSSRRRCGGYIAWKYNDSWPEIYSAKVDYFLEPYLPYYAIRRAYAPVLVSIEIGTYISVWVVNDSVEQIAGTLTVRLFHMDRNSVTREVSREAVVAPDASTPVLRLDEAGIGSFRREHVVHAELVDPSGRLIARASSLTGIDRRLIFPDAKLTVAVDKGVIVLTTDRFARSVFLEGNADGDEFGWLFEDNWFDLLPGETKRVRVLGRHNSGKITAGAWHSPHRTTVEWRR
jgi:beta-mannosidase